MSGWKRLFVVLCALWAIAVGVLSSKLYNTEVSRFYESDACWRQTTSEEIKEWKRNKELSRIRETLRYAKKDNDKAMGEKLLSSLRELDNNTTVTWENADKYGYGFKEGELDKMFSKDYIPSLPVWNDDKTAHIVRCNEKFTEVADEYYWKKKGMEVVVKRMDDYKSMQYEVMQFIVLLLLLPPLIVYMLFMSTLWVVRGFKK